MYLSGQDSGCFYNFTETEVSSQGSRVYLYFMLLSILW